MPVPRPILKLAEADTSYATESALPFTESRGFDTPHVHFPPTPIMTSTAITHSPFIYDRAPIVVSQNVCELPERGGRAFIPDLPNKSTKPSCKRTNTGYFHPAARGSSEDSSSSEEVVSSPSSPILAPFALNDFYNYHNQLQQGRSSVHHRPPPLVYDHGSDMESPLPSSLSHLSFRHYSACSVPTSRSVSPTHTASASSSAFLSCPPSPGLTSDMTLSARMVGLSLGITSTTTTTTVTTTTTTPALITKEHQRKTRSKEQSLERERDRHDKLERFNAEEGKTWTTTNNITNNTAPRTSTSKSRRRRLSASSSCSFQEPALEGCLGGF